jgi:hypothetical protein
MKCHRELRRAMAQPRDLNEKEIDEARSISSTAWYCNGTDVVECSRANLANAYYVQRERKFRTTFRYQLLGSEHGRVLNR